MKKKIFDFLINQCNIDVSELLVSGVKNGFIGIIDTKDSSDENISLVYTVQKDEDEIDFYLFCISDNWSKDKITSFMDGLKLLLNEHSDKKIVKSSYEKDWYHWEDDTLKLSFGMRSEKSGFSLRISFPSTELSNCNHALSYFPTDQY